MELLAALITLALVINIWATSFVARRVRTGRERTLMFALIWLVPGGAIVAMFLAIGRRRSESTDSRRRMLEAIAENYRQTHTKKRSDRSLDG